MMVQAEPRSTAPLHYVRSVGEFAAPPAVVWRHVVAFPALPPATEWVFRVGVAAPLAARIRGSGVGALRFCDFTTEVVVRWDPLAGTVPLAWPLVDAPGFSVWDPIPAGGGEDGQ